LAENLGSIRAEIILKIDRLQQSAKKASNSIRELGNNISKEMSNAKKDIKDAFETIGVNADSAKTALIGAGVGIAGGLLAMSAGAQETEKTFRKFEAQTGLTGKELENFNKKIKDSYLKGYGEDLAEVSDTYQKYQRSLKLSAKETQKLTEGSFVLRDLYDYDIQDSLNAVTSIVKNFGVEGGKALDIVTKSAQQSGDRAGDLLDTFGEYSQQFSKLGFNAEEFAGILVRGLQDGQFNTDQLGDSVKEFGVNLLELAKEDDKNLKDIIGNKKVYSKIVKGLSKDTKNTAGTMELVNAKLKAEKDLVKRNALGTALYGTLWEELGGDAVLALTEIDGGLKDFEGSNKKANETLKGNKVTMKEVSRQLKSISDEFGTRLAPYISKAIIKLSEFLTKILDFVEANPVITKIGVAFGIVASVISTLLGVVILIYPYIQTAITVFTALSGVLGTVVGAVLAFIGTIGALPIIIGVAIVALVALIIWKWEEIKEFTISIWNSIIEFFKGLPETLKNLWNDFFDWLISFTQSTGENVNSIWEDILSFITSIPDKIYTFFTQTLPKFVGFVIGTFLKLHIKLGKEIYKTYTVYLPNLILTGLTKMYNFFTSTVPKILSKIGELAVKGTIKFLQFRNMLIQKAKEAITGAYNWIKQLPGKVISIGISAYNKAKSVGNMIKNGLINTIKTLPGKVSQIIKDAIKGVGSLGSKAYSALKNIGRNMWNGFKQGMGIHSPSYIEKAMFKINDASKAMRETLYNDIKSLKKLPNNNTLRNLAGNNITNNNSSNRRIINNFNSPLVSVGNGEKIPAGYNLGTNVYNEILKKMRGEGV